MRTAVLTLLALALGSTTAHAQASWADRMFKAGTTHDFGSVPRGAQLFYRFEITNIYAVPLEIIQTRTSCGCVTVSPSVKVLKPGGKDPSGKEEKATIDITMDARRFTGPKTVSIYVTVGPTYVSTATLTVTANSRADVVFNPGQVSFGVVPRGQTPTQTIEVEYAGVLDWKVLEVAKTDAPLEATFKETYRRPGQVGYSVSVTLKPDAPPGIVKEELLLKTNDPASPLVPVLVEATLQAPLSVSPSVVSLGSLKVGAPVTRRVMVKGNGNPFRIVAVEGQGGGVQADLPAAPAPVHFLTLKCQPEKAGDLRQQLRIKTDLSGESVVTVTVEGHVEP
jgi:hypothetical protein